MRPNQYHRHVQDRREMCWLHRHRVMFLFRFTMTVIVRCTCQANSGGQRNEEKATEHFPLELVGTYYLPKDPCASQAPSTVCISTDYTGADQDLISTMRQERESERAAEAKPRHLTDKKQTSLSC